MFVQYEIWGLLQGHEQLLECVPTLREAEQVAEDLLVENEEIWIVKDTDDDIVEVRRYRNQDPVV
jgi:hypothetical protein